MKDNNPPISKKSNLVLQELDNEIMIYDLAENKAFCLNQTSALVWQYCDGKNSISQICDLLNKKLNSNLNEDFVWLAIEQLKKEKLFENGQEIEIPFDTANRRQLIKKIGLSTLVALPVVASLIAPVGIQAASCIGLQGTGCISSPNTCCPGSPTLNCNNDTLNNVMRCCTSATGGRATNASSGNATATNNCGQTTDAQRILECNADTGAVCCSGMATWNSAAGQGSGNPCVFACICL